MQRSLVVVVVCLVVVAASGGAPVAQADRVDLADGLWAALAAVTFVDEQKVSVDEAGGGFGWSVALDGDTALVGARWNPDAGADRGSVYVFTRSDTSWSLQQELLPADAAVDNVFSGSVALDGDTALVGAPYDGTGSVYVFTRSAGSWSEAQKLSAADGAAGDSFGISLILDGDTAVVGARWDDSGRGAAYVFARSGTSWSEQQKLTAADGAAGDYFGWSVALDGDTALVGAVGDDFSEGAAYVFTRSGTGWTEGQKLTGSDGRASDAFGHSVALDGDTALVGALWADVGENEGQGSAYVFTRSAGSWSEVQKLTAADGVEWDRFGGAVALNGDTALVGVPGNDFGADPDADYVYNQGGAYVFTRSAGSWSEVQKLTAADAEGQEEFGAALALVGDAALVGAPDDNVYQGSAYFYRAETPELVYLPVVVGE